MDDRDFNPAHIEKVTLLPTHTCFDDAIRFITIFNEPFIRREAKIVHAICFGNAGGEPYAHAWVEFRDPDLGLIAVQGAKLHDEQIYVGQPMETFNKMYRPARATRYSFVSAVIFSALNDSGGPWEPGLLKLCGDAQRIRGWFVGTVTSGKAAIYREPERVRELTTTDLLETDAEVRLIGSLLSIGDHARINQILAEVDHLNQTADGLFRGKKSHGH